MPALANHKHELFAQALAKGEPASAAYIAAGYARNDGNSIRLKGNEKVALRVVELQERAAIKVELSVLDIISMLQEDRELARTIEQPSAAVSASLGIAKVLGMLKDKVEHSGGITIDHTVEAERKIEEWFGPTPHEIIANG